MTLDPFGRPLARPVSPPATPTRQHMVVVVPNSAAGMRTAERAGRLAAASDSRLTVVLVLREPWGLALAAHLFTVHFPLDDVELDVVLHLSGVLDALGVAWRLAPVTERAADAVAALHRKEPVWCVIVGRAGPFMVRRTPWIARALRRKHGLPVLVVTPEPDDSRKEPYR
jgi:hypothetical protein